MQHAVDAEADSAADWTRSVAASAVAQMLEVATEVATYRGAALAAAAAATATATAPLVIVTFAAAAAAVGLEAQPVHARKLVIATVGRPVVAAATATAIAAVSVPVAVLANVLWTTVEAVTAHVTVHVVVDGCELLATVATTAVVPVCVTMTVICHE